MAGYIDSENNTGVIVSLESYQKKTNEQQSNYDSGFGSEVLIIGNGSQSTGKTTGLENIEESVENLRISIGNSKTEVSSSQDQESDSRTSILIRFVIAAFTPDSDNDTYLTISLAKNAVQMSLQLIEICPRSCYLDIATNDFGQAAIHIAAYLNIYSAVYSLIMKRARVDVIDYKGKNVFHYCAERGHMESFIAVLDAGEKTKQKERIIELLHSHDDDGQTPFFVAATQKHIGICRALALMNINTNLKDRRDGCSPLHSVIRNKEDSLFVEFLIVVCRLKVNSQNMSGSTPLHIAAANNDKKTCSVLLKHGADIEITNFSDKKPVEYVVDQELVDLLQTN